MPENLGSAILDLRSDDTHLNRGIRKAKSSATQLDSRFKRTATSIRNSLGGIHSALVAVGIGAFFTSAVRTMADFEKQMNRVRAVSGASADQFAALQDQARSLGATTVFSASEAADAMGFLAQAGFKTNDIIGAMPATLDLAAAGQMDLAASADIVSNVMTTQGMQASETGHAVDVLTKAFTSANTNLLQLGEAFTYAGNVSNISGLSFEETTAALSLMGNAGLQASLAGTSLRGAITKLLNPTDEAVQILDDLGIQIKDSEGRMRPLADLIEDLGPLADDTGALMEIFGQRAGPGVAALIKQGAGKLRDLTKELENAGGTAKKIAEQQMEGLLGQLKALNSAWDELMLSFGDTGILSGLTTVVESVTAIIRDATQGFQRMQIGMINFFLTTARAATEWELFGTKIELAPGLIGMLEQSLVKAVNALNETEKAATGAAGGPGGGKNGGEGGIAGLSDSSDKASDAADELTRRYVRLGKITGDLRTEVDDLLAAELRHQRLLERRAPRWQNFTNLTGSLKEETDALYEAELRHAKMLAKNINLEEEAQRIRDKAAKSTRASAALTGAAEDFGRRAGSQIAGVSGAIAGFQQGGPWGAAAGFFADLLLRNEKMQELLGLLSDTLVELLDPIVEAIAPSLEAIAPVMQELAPVFKIIGKALELYLKPLTFFLQALSKYTAQIVAPIVSLSYGIVLLADYIRVLIDAIGNVSFGGSGIPGLPFHSGGTIDQSDIIRVPGLRSDEGFLRSPVQTGETINPRAGNRTIQISLGGASDSMFSKSQVRRLVEAIREELADDSTGPTLEIV